MSARPKGSPRARAGCLEPLRKVAQAAPYSVRPGHTDRDGYDRLGPAITGCSPKPGPARQDQSARKGNSDPYRARARERSALKDERQVRSSSSEDVVEVCGRSECDRLAHSRESSGAAEPVRAGVDRLPPIARSIRMEALAEMTFAALEARAAVGKGSARTATEHRRRWRLHLADRIGRRKLHQVTKATVLGLRDQLRADGLAESSIGSVLVVLRSVLSYSRQADFTTADPFRSSRRGELPSPAESSKEKRVLRVGEIWRLLDATLYTYTPVVMLLAWSGLGVSEAIGLRWRHVDFVDGLFRVEEQLPPLKPGEVPYTVQTKSKRGVREMPFLPVVAETLAAHLELELAASRGQADDFVFCTRSGRPYTRQNISERGIEKAGKRAGLGEDIRAQVLRHSFCTFVAESGIPPNEGAALAGHDEQTWWRNYVQPRRDAQARRDSIAKLTAFGVGVRPEVDQKLTNRD
jgi:integrase